MVSAANTEAAAIDRCIQVLTDYLPARLEEVGALHSVTLRPPDMYFRGIVEPGQSFGAAIGLRPAQAQKELRHSMQKVVYDVTAKVALAGGPCGLHTGAAVSRALALYTDAVGFVLQRYVRGGQHGVYHCQETRKAPPRELVGKDRAGNWGGTRECTVRVFQQQPIV